MAVIYSTDFESEAALSDIFDLQVGSTASFGADQTHDGARSLKIAQTGTSSPCRKTVPGSPTTLVVRFWIRLSQLPPTAFEEFVHVIAGGDVFSLRVSTTGLLSASFAGNFPQNWATIAANTWYAIDLKLVAAGGSHSIDGKVNGADQPQAAHSAADVAFSEWDFNESGSNTFTTWYDQWQLANAAADYPLTDAVVGSVTGTAAGAATTGGSAAGSPSGAVAAVYADSATLI